MAYERLSEILSTISDLNKNNIIERVKEKLEKEDPDTYKEWQGHRFDINYTFNNQNTLLHIAAVYDLIKIVEELLIKKGLMLIQQIEMCVLLCIMLPSMNIKEIVELLLDKWANAGTITLLLPINLKMEKKLLSYQK